MKTFYEMTTFHEIKTFHEMTTFHEMKTFHAMTTFHEKAAYAIVAHLTGFITYPKKKSGLVHLLFVISAVF